MQGIAIRSLKSDALLLDVGADGSPSLKISYFGYAKHDNSVARTIATPLLYIAPEVLGYGEYDVKVRATHLFFLATLGDWCVSASCPLSVGPAGS